MAPDQALIAVGFGCRAGVRAEALCRAFEAALGVRGVLRFAVRGLFAPATRAEEPGLHEAAIRLALPLTFLEHGILAAQAAHTLTQSAQSLAHTGLPSVAECCALAGVLGPARLLAPRIVVDGVTSALAGPLGVP